MVNLRPILLVIGSLLTILAVAMTIPAIADAVAKNPDWRTFISSAFFTGFIGMMLVLTNQGEETKNISLKQAFILTSSVWVVLCAFSALPFRFAGIGLSYTDAFFEAMSGLTTTGATVISGLDDTAPGILLWRSILQWLGGIGIIVMAMAVLPILKIGGMQLFRTESSDKSEKVLPRVTQVSSAITGVYTLLTFICFMALWLAGMTAFDAFCHTMSTLSTGGFSTHDASIAFFKNTEIELIMTLFMFMGGIPFVLYIQFFRGKPQALLKDAQIKWYFAFVIISIIAVASWLIIKSDKSVIDSFKVSAFNVISVITTSGFATEDYSKWGNFIVTFIFILSVVGGCTGSTSGGIKIFRYQVLYETAKAQINQLIQPHGIFRPLFNGKPISESTTSAVLAFFTLFAFCFSVLTILVSLSGVDYVTSMSGVASMMANVGPGLGDIIGPAGNYSSLPDAAKWLFTAGMMIGRLEIFTVLILFSPYFWRS